MNESMAEDIAAAFPLGREGAVERVRQGIESLNEPDDLLAMIYDMMAAGIRRHATIAVFAGLDPSPLRDRIGALYDGHIAAGLTDDEAAGRIVAVLQAEGWGPKGILAATDEPA